MVVTMQWVDCADLTTVFSQEAPAQGTTIAGVVAQQMSTYRQSTQTGDVSEFFILEAELNYLKGAVGASHFLSILT
jgi:hypothetical protein